MKVAYVTPRYGEEIVGGAEHAARMLAERLVTQLGWDVEVLTSCALSADTWANELPAGESDVHGVRVRRFPTTTPRGTDFPNLSWKVHRNPKLAHPKDQSLWVDSQGPLMPSAIDAIADCDADVAVFYPYLYYPTVRGVLAAREANMPTVMHPAAHDEVPIRMSIYAKVFAATNGFVFQTDGERRLAESLFSIADKPQLLLGLGVDPQDGSTDDFRTRLGIGDRPYVVCMGRVDAGKGSVLLARYFAEYKERHPGDLVLVNIGPVMQQLPPHPDIVVTGVVSEEDKWAVLRGAELLVQPSPFEAFSLALIEGWAAGKPVLVNASCLATREHVERCEGGLWFDGYNSFAVAMHRLLSDRDTASTLAARGQAYVTGHFHWPALIDRYGRFLQQIVDRQASQRWAS